MDTTLVTPDFLECFFNIWFGMVQNQKKLIDAHKVEILFKIYWLCRAEKDNHYELFKCFLNPSNFIAVRFVWLKKVKVNCTSVLPILLFYFLVDFFKKNTASVKISFFCSKYFFAWCHFSIMARIWKCFWHSIQGNPSTAYHLIWVHISFRLMRRQKCLPHQLCEVHEVENQMNKTRKQ